MITKTFIGEIENISLSISKNGSFRSELMIKTNIYFSKCLLKYSVYCPDVIKNHLSTIYNIASISMLCEEVVVNLCGVIFHTLYINKQKDVSNEFKTKIIDILYSNKRYWCLYLIAKEAMFYSHYILAELILEKIKDHVDSETNYFYLKAMLYLSKAENSLMKKDNLDAVSCETIEESIKLLDQALIQLKASGVNNCGFQAVCVGLRKQFLDHILNLTTQLANCNPKDLSSEKVILSHQEQCFTFLSDKFNNTINSFFDIDETSSRMLSLHSMACRVISKTISTMTPVQDNMNGHNNIMSINNNHHNSSELRTDPLLVQCEHILRQVENMNSAQRPYNKALVLHKIIKALLHVGFPVPQFFFSTVPDTVLKLEIEINNSHNIYTKPVSAILGQGLVIKFSGYITQRKKRQNQKRKVKAVCLTMEKRQVSTDNMASVQEETQKFVVPVVEQSFQKKCLCHFAAEGKYHLAIRTQMIDENDCHVWWTSNLASDAVLMQAHPTSSSGDERKCISIFVDVKTYTPTTTRLTL